MSNGLRITRRFTEAGKDPYDQFEWSRRDSRITNPDGSVVFEMSDAEIPAHWSQVASDVMVSKYFRKAGVPQYDEDGNQLLDESGEPVTGPERSAKQVFDRLAGTWRHWGEKEGYFASIEDAESFEDELRYMLANQIAAPNSPQWFNTGLNWAYGLTGPAQGFWYVDNETGEMTESPDSYSRPAPHACFLLGVKDDLVNPGGIMDLWVREARIFKFGSGAGSNFSAIRAEGELLSGGGKSSGVMSFLKIGDRAAGAVKCLHADTEIVTDEGTFPIRMVEPGDSILTRHGLSRVTGVHDNGTRPLVRVRTELGDEILTTPEHRFRVRNAEGEQWKEVREITAEDHVQVDLAATPIGTTQALKPVDPGHFNEITHDLPLVLNESFALWLGWVTGDGSITTRPSAKFVAVQIGDEDPELTDRYTDLVKAVFGSTAHVFVNRRSDGREDASASVRFASSQIIRFLEANGLRKGSAQDAAIPHLVKSSPPGVRAAFLSGLFEADGHVDNGYPVLSTVSYTLARDAHRLLLGLGIPSAVKTQHNRSGAIGTLPIHLVRIVGGEGVRRFAKVVGFVSERKHSLLEGAVERKSVSPYETQWVLPHAREELNAIWESGSSQLRRAVAPYCRYQKPRSLSLLRARVLMDRFSLELESTVVERFAEGQTLYQQVSVEPAGKGPVFDLTVEGVHEYTVQGLVTHNSGGTTRRAAKMVILDADHPDIETFVDWKKVEEEKAKLLISHGGFPADFNGEAYATVSGQNSNNSVRVTDDFIRAVENDDDWDLINRTDGTVRKTIKARDLWDRIAEAAWACADPGIQFDTTINEWHTSPAGGRIRTSNPCFTGDTRVATDKGLIQFKTLVKRVADGESFQVYTHDATNEDSPSETIDLTSPTQVMVTGTNQILRLEFSDGRSLRCTPNHRLWTRDHGWVRADELSEDHRVRLLDQDIDFGMASWSIPVSTEASYYQQRSSRQYQVRLPEKWTEDFAHYLGWLIGDGSLTDETAVTIYGTEAEQQTTMLLHRDLLAEINGGFAPKPVEMGNGTYQLRASRGAIRKFLQALGVSQVKAGEKRVPWSIFEAPKPIVAAFLRGLYDADGCVHWGDTTRYVGLGSVSKKLLQGVQQLIETFGVHGSIYGTKKPLTDVFEYTTNSGEKRSYDSRQVYDLRVMGRDLEKFSQHIGFGLTIKDDILDQMLRETTRYRTRHWVKLKSRAEEGWETTYNLTEPRNHSYVAEGVLVSNCGEYNFLDDTACNLASVNLVRFYDDETGVFDIEAYQHAIRIWTMVLEISVAMAHFPSQEIAQGSYDYRTLGLGYANLGSLLMRQGIAYDSDEGRAIAGALTAILTGFSYATSAEIAGVLGPFPRYEENRESMLRVIRNHRVAAYDGDDYDGVTSTVMGIDVELCPENLLDAARESWDLALQRGEKNGYRNAQASVIAPTGTIALVLDCDTTGIEPDFALVKFKKLAGGGYFKIVNQSVGPALTNMGYHLDQINDVVEYIVGTSSLEGAPHINRESLTEKGFTREDLDKLEANLPSVFELKHAFNVFTLGEGTLGRLGFDPGEYTAWDFDLLRAIGFTKDQIAEANDHICGRQTIEGAPHIKEEHLRVFDTANKNGKYGRRFIHHNGHIKMMAAAQPFISGAISKTINMPTEVTTEDIEEAYHLSWELGLKAMAIYRDGSKASQPLSATADEGEQSEDETAEITSAVEQEKVIHWGNLPAGISPTQAYAQGMQPPRFLLPARRSGFNQEARVGGHKVFLRTGEYDDGSLGEIFIDLAKEGATLKGILSCFAIAVSKGLQYGVPLDEFVDTFTFQTFEPRGMVEGHPHIKMSNSIIDYVFRALGVEYLLRDELAQVPPDRGGDIASPPQGLAVDAGVQLDLSDAVAEDDVEVVAKAAEFVDSPDAGVPVPVAEKTAATVAAGEAAATPDLALAENMGDAPVCSNCGHMTIRNGSCYVCLTCGDTTGCS